MGAPERAYAAEQARYRLARDGMDPERLEPPLALELGQDRRHAPREHGLARTGGTDHEQAEPARSRDGQRPLGNLLSGDVGEVELLPRPLMRHRLRRPGAPDPIDAPPEL